MLICSVEFGIPRASSLRTALGSVGFADSWRGSVKCPFFGALMALSRLSFGIADEGRHGGRGAGDDEDGGGDVDGDPRGRFSADQGDVPEFYSR
jgi:hypothetical protein